MAPILLLTVYLSLECVYGELSDTSDPPKNERRFAPGEQQNSLQNSLNPGLSACNEIHLGCLNCDDDVCLECDSSLGLKLDSFSKKCICNSGYYLSEESPEMCLPCSSMMEGCIMCDESTQCKQCGRGYYLKLGQHYDTCMPCLGTCRQCEGSNTCTVCDTDCHSTTPLSGMCHCEPSHSDDANERNNSVHELIVSPGDIVKKDNAGFEWFLLKSSVNYSEPNLRFEWTVTDLNASFTSFVKAMDKPILWAPVSQLPEGFLEFTLKVFLEDQTIFSASRTIEVVKASSSSLFDISPQKVTARMDQAVRVSIKLKAAWPHPHFEWVHIEGGEVYNSPDFNYEDYPESWGLTFSPSILTACETHLYNMTLRNFYKGHSNYLESVQYFELTILPPPFDITIHQYTVNGGDQNILFLGSGLYYNNLAGFSYTWTCSDEDGNPCEDENGNPLFSDETSPVVILGSLAFLGTAELQVQVAVRNCLGETETAEFMLTSTPQSVVCQPDQILWNGRGQLVLSIRGRAESMQLFQLNGPSLIDFLNDASPRSNELMSWDEQLGRDNFWDYGDLNYRKIGLTIPGHMLAHYECYTVALVYTASWESGVHLFHWTSGAW